MVAKRGNTLWTVTKNHPYWNYKKVATVAMSYSRNPSGVYTLAIVGTTRNDQSSVFSYTLTGLSRREKVASQVLKNFYKTWLWQYNQR